LKQHPDHKYIDALISNDSTLLAELYQRFSGKVRQWILNNSGQEPDAADIFQEALVAIFRKAQQPDFVLTCPFDAFLHTVCRHLWLNELRKRKRQPVTLGEAGLSNRDEDMLLLADQAATEHRKKNLLLQQWGKISEGCRELLHLAYTGKPLEEVARLLNVSYGYVRKKKSECMARLSQLVRESDEYPLL
jgi:RNA polymerase sigma factor (sigma-70 family)